MKIKHIPSFTLFFLLFFIPSIWSQSIDYNKIIPSDSAAAKDIGEKLVLLAWKNNPDNAQVIDAASAANYEYKTSTVTWLNSLVFTGNLNEYNLTKQQATTNQNIFFPRYNIGLNIPAGIYPVNHYTSRSFKKRFAVKVDQINSQKLELRRKVLNAYQEYLLAKELLKIQTTTSEESSTDLLIMQKKFKENRGTLQAYNEAQQKFTAESVTKLSYQRNFIVAKNDLERLIGVGVSEVIKD